MQAIKFEPGDQIPTTQEQQDLENVRAAQAE